MNGLDLEGVTEKWASLLTQLEKYELENGYGKYFGGEEKLVALLLVMVSTSCVFRAMNILCL